MDRMKFKEGDKVRYIKGIYDAPVFKGCNVFEWPDKAIGKVMKVSAAKIDPYHVVILNFPTEINSSWVREECLELCSGSNNKIQVALQALAQYIGE